MTFQDMLLIALRLASVGFGQAGKVRTVQAIDAIAVLVNANQNVEAHMAEVKRKLDAGEVNDDAWEDLARRMQEDSDRIQRS